MNKIIKELISVHKEESILSKKLKKLKEDVRAYMQKNNVSSITVDDGEVIIKEVEQTSFNEDNFQTIKKHGRTRGGRNATWLRSGVF